MFHPCQARIRLDCIRRNLENVRAFLGPGPRLLLCTKANSYGHGAVAVAAMVQQAGLADWFGVATVLEALQLRRGGIRLPILRFYPSHPDEMAAAVEAGITLNVCDRANVKALQAVCGRLGLGARVHLEVETGMGRCGVGPEQAPALARFIESECPGVFLEGVFTHFPEADMASGGPFTRRQVAVFRQALDRIAQALGRMPELVHAANSGALVAHPESRFTMLRTGTLAYGYYPPDRPERPIPLEPSLSLVARIAHLSFLPQGEGPGTWVAALPLGLADGIDRRFAQGGRVLVGSRSCPVAGPIQIDHMFVDLGPGPPARVGDEAVLVGTSCGQEISLYEVAETAGTLPCAFTACLGPRVERVHVPITARPGPGA